MDSPSAPTGLLGTIEGMPRAPRPLPRSLGRAFTSADAGVAGVADQRLRRGDLVAVTHGVHSLDRLDGDARLAAVALGMPAPFAYSHLTAARIWDLPLPGWTDADERLHVIRPTSGAQVRRPGITGHRGLETRATTSARGLPVTTRAETWADLAAVGLTRDDLVVVGDAVVRGRPELLAGLHRVSARARRLGATRLRDAAALVRVGSRSAMETRTRLALVQAGLPEPLLNARICTDDGEEVACCDLVWPDAKVVVEYEGDHHRTDRAQWRLDITRVRRLESLGWRVLRITADDLRGSRLADLVSLLRGLLA